ncbi:uncharacterized protein K02A2.6-like [Ornithodoros turicata]|uniref:uncharacterized protein K02A2.6-like n=1 Tax=Ornithodoros turicata TaxID=34597 RepID=UPI003138DB3F
MPTLMGRNWLTEVRLDWNTISHIREGDPENRFTKYKNVFEKSFGNIRGYTGTLTLKENVRPVLCKARTVPFALREKVDDELRTMENDGILYRVQTSDWATPLVIVPKKESNKIRLCGDYRVTVNPYLKVNDYPLPLPEDVFANLAGGECFTVLDLAKAYLHLGMDEYSQELLTINTHLGLYRFTRLPCGIASAPAIFQSVMDQILSDVPGTVCYLDDVLISGKDYHECNERLNAVLARLQAHSIRVNKSKCQFFQNSVKYLGHEIDGKGIRPTKEHIEAIAKASRPRNLTELKAFLGLLNYCGRFLPNIATTATSSAA